MIWSSGAQHVCQEGASIGSHDRTQYEEEADHGGRFYLNVDNSSSCDGIVTQWNYCYYKSDSEGVREIHFAVYRKMLMTDHRPGPGGHKPSYGKTLESSISIDESSLSSLNQDFICTNFTPTVNVTIHQGDVLGVYIPRERQIDIVSGTEDSEEEGWTTPRLLYRDDKKMPDNRRLPDNRYYLPSVIPEGSLTSISNLVIHLYANIIGKLM